MCLFMVYPFVWMVSATFKSGAEVYSLNLIPRTFTLENYNQVINSYQFPRWFLNSLLVGGVCTVSVLLFDSLTGYVFSKFRFRGKQIMFIMILSTMMIPTEMMIIPWYLLISRFGFNNTYLSVIFPSLCTAFGVFLTKQFFMGVPTDLLEAARIDGMGELRIFFSVAMPLIKPALSALGIFTFLNVWNGYLWPVIALDKSDMYTITVGLSWFSSEARQAWELIMAGASISTVPILIVFIIFQRRIIEGIQLAGLKG